MHNEMSYSRDLDDSLALYNHSAFSIMNSEFRIKNNSEFPQHMVHSFQSGRVFGTQTVRPTNETPFRRVDNGDFVI